MAAEGSSQARARVMACTLSNSAIDPDAIHVTYMRGGSEVRAAVHKSTQAGEQILRILDEAAREEVQMCLIEERDEDVEQGADDETNVVKMIGNGGEGGNTQESVEGAEELEGQDFEIEDEPEDTGKPTQGIEVVEEEEEKDLIGFMLDFLDLKEAEFARASYERNGTDDELSEPRNSKRIRADTEIELASDKVTKKQKTTTWVDVSAQEITGAEYWKSKIEALFGRNGHTMKVAPRKAAPHAHGSGTIVPIEPLIHQQKNGTWNNNVTEESSGGAVPRTYAEVLKGANTDQSEVDEADAEGTTGEEMALAPMVTTATTSLDRHESGPRSWQDRVNALTRESQRRKRSGEDVDETEREAKKLKIEMAFEYRSKPASGECSQQEEGALSIVEASSAAQTAACVPAHVPNFFPQKVRQSVLASTQGSSLPVVELPLMVPGLAWSPEPLPESLSQTARIFDVLSNQSSSLPIVNIPSRAPSSALHPAPQPKHLARRLLRSEVTSAEIFQFQQNV